MNSTTGLNQSARTLILRSDLRQLRIQVDLHAAGDTLHRLRNSLATAQGALALIEQRHRNGSTAEVEELFDLAEQRIQEVRARLVSTRQVRFAGYRRPALVA